MKFSAIALVGAATLAAAQHKHAHRHPARHGSPVEARNPDVTETVPAAVVTVYELNGDDIPWDEVEAGLKDGKYVLVGDKISTVIPVPPSTSSTPTPTPSTSEAAKFFEKPSTSTTPTSTYVPPTTSAAPTTSSTPAPAPGSSSSSSNGGGNIDSDFPSGTIPCSHFPSDYGAVYIDWLGLGGWSGIQNTPNYNILDNVISYIETAVSGSTCTENSFCSYACPAGYQKSQWPKAQGNTGQSIGGLYCNSNGMLELSRESETKICTRGVGGVKVTNKLSSNAAICRTDYPGSESETVPLNTQPGQTYELTCPDANTYYSWQNSPTSAQYYINNAGVSESDACQWGTAGSNRGNWAPVNMGVGRGKDGNTYISLFPNAPTNPDGKLNFNIKITGAVSGDCSYSGGKYYSSGNEAPTGCTVSRRKHFE